MAMLSLMAAATMALTLTVYRGEKHAFDRARADAVLEAGVTRAVLGIGAATAADRWRVDGVPRRFVFDGETLSVAIQDEAGRFDLNAADVSVFQTLLRNAGAEPKQAEAIADRMLDWRANDEAHALGGGSDEDYAAARLAWRPRHGPFQSVDEARLVLGMTPALFARIRPALTVYSRQGDIDRSTAPRAALAVFYGASPGALDNILAARNGAPPPDGVTLSTLGGIIDPATPLAGRAFTVTVEATIKGRRYTRETTLRLTGDPARPYLTLAWR